MKNNYVIFWSGWDLYKQSFADLRDKSYARFINSPTMYMSKFKRFLYNEQHRHPRVNKKLANLFGEKWIQPKVWYPSYFKNDFENNKELVFVLNKTWITGEYVNYLSYLKKIYSKAKFVLVLFDLCHKNGGLNVEWAKKNFDLILSFDQNDCLKYGFTYHPLVFSSFHDELDDLPQKDVFFLGQPKDRLNEIIGCLERLWENNVTTDVQLIWVDPKDRVYKDRISYKDEVVPYKTNLQHFLHANCALEIMQHGGVGYTQRMCEAIAFDKKILTNNSLIHEAPFYNENYIFQINSPADITPELCQRIKQVESVDYHYKEKLSPIELLNFIEKELE